MVVVCAALTKHWRGTLQMTGGNTVTITGTGFSVGSKTAMCKFDGLM